MEYSGVEDSEVEDSEGEDSEVEHSRMMEDRETRMIEEAPAERTRREEFSWMVKDGAYLHSNRDGPRDNI